MAKKVVALIKLAIPAGKANPAPPIGPALGQHGVNIMAFCKEYNAKTQDKVGLVVPVEISVFEDRSFTFILKNSPGFSTYQESCRVSKRDRGAEPPPQVNKVGSITRAQLQEIAETKNARPQRQRH